ncbi:hypothetical protein DID78_07280, partial [Candidatus Marinamargulisbacteria bacterium SCGC AG-343-D04]
MRFMKTILTILTILLAYGSITPAQIQVINTPSVDLELIETPILTLQANLSLNGELIDTSSIEGGKNITVKVYKDQVIEGTEVYSESFENVEFSDGNVEIDLGISKAIQPRIFNSSKSFLSLSIDDEVTIIPVNTVPRAMYAFDSPASVTANKFPNLNTFNNHILMVNSSATSFSYVSTSNLFTALGLGSAATHDISDISSHNDSTITHLVTSGNLWDQAYSTTNLITSPYNAESWNKAVSTANLITNDLLISIQNVENLNDIRATSNLITSAYNADNWDAAFATANKIPQSFLDNLSDINAIRATADLITSDYNASNWDAAFSTANLITADLYTDIQNINDISDIRAT